MYQASICTYYVEFRSKTTHSFLLSKGLADFRGKTTCIRYVSVLTMGLADFRGKTTCIRYVFVLTIGLADFRGKTTCIRYVFVLRASRFHGQNYMYNVFSLLVIEKGS